MKQHRVFGIGLGRTGTRSLTKALKILGYRFIQHPIPFEIMNEYDAAVGSVASLHYRHLAQLYPDALFILTLRDLDSWLASWTRYSQTRPYQSCFSEFKRPIRLASYGVVGFERDHWQQYYLKHTAEVMQYFNYSTTLKQGLNKFGRPSTDTSNGKSASYSRLLAIDICSGEGWSKLCPFLGEPIPRKTFPRITHRETERLKQIEDRSGIE